MKKIFSLTKVFIKEFYQNLPIFDKEKKKFNKKSIVFWLMAIVFLAVIYVSYEAITFLIEVGQPQIFLNLYFFILATLLLFQTTLVCANLFFFSKDIEKILHLPIKPVELLLAKLNTLLCMLYISEAIIGFVPLTLYGLLTHAHLLFYLWEVILLVIFPIFVAILISTVLLLIMRFAKFIRNKDVFQLIITILFIIIFCVLESKILTGVFTVKNDEQALQQFSNLNQKVEQIGKYFLIINPCVTILSNPIDIQAILSFIKLMIYYIISGFIFITIGKITYLKDILKNLVSSTRKKKKEIEIEKNIRCYTKRKSYILKDVKTLIREPIFFMQCVFPVAIILVTGILSVAILLPTITEIMKDDTIQKAIQNLSFNTEIICDILIVLQVLFSISNISLTAISREGKNAIFMKQIPIGLYQQFVYKNVPQIMLNFVVSIVVLGMIWYLVPTIHLLYLFMIWMIAMLMNLINSYLMLVVDLRRPNLDWDTEYSVVKKSDNKVFQYAFMILNVLFLMYLSKIFSEMNVFIALIGEIAIFATVFIILDRCVKKWQNKLFDKIN